MANNLEILVFLRASASFSNLIFEELEILLNYLEVVELRNGRADPPAGYSILYQGCLDNQVTGESFVQGSVVNHPGDSGPWLARESVTLLHFSTISTNALFRKEPELALLVKDQFEAERKV